MEEETALDNGEWLVEVEGVADGTELLGLEAYRGWLGEAACCDPHNRSHTDHTAPHRRPIAATREQSHRERWPAGNRIRDRREHAGRAIAQGNRRPVARHGGSFKQIEA